ncbi:hypothetical protein AMECASPLE_028394 [Ameca splendens]|uniref:Secreted protein n=1 Tax=Ameca splendens TaxID=208324 RepID=A0ABV0Y5G5_9TELE
MLQVIVLLWKSATHSVLPGLCAASLINAHIARSVSFGGQSSLGRFVVVPCAFHLKMMDLMPLQDDTKDLDIFYNPIRTCLESHGVVAKELSKQLCLLLVWKAPRSLWCDASCVVVLQPLWLFRKGVF